jgi:GNAT superfamily N-acetyltransferase
MVSSDITFRTATLEDCAVILHQRRGMFRDMGNGTIEELDKMVEATRPWLERALADGSYHGWLAQATDGRVVAGGGVLISSWPARPEDLNTRRALIVNVYTEPEFRQRGLARQVMLLIIKWLKDDGFRSVVLHASAEGRRLYHSLGFIPTNEMRLRLTDANETDQ